MMGSKRCAEESSDLIEVPQKTLKATSAAPAPEISEHNSDEEYSTATIPVSPEKTRREEANKPATKQAIFINSYSPCLMHLTLNHCFLSSISLKFFKPTALNK